MSEEEDWSNVYKLSEKLGVQENRCYKRVGC